MPVLNVRDHLARFARRSFRSNPISAHKTGLLSAPPREPDTAAARTAFDEWRALRDA
jgi:hypothetical protein